MYKKIYAYLSVLLLVGSIFSSPLTSMADTNFYRDATTGKVNPEKSVSDKKEQTVRTAKIDQVDGGKTTSSSMLGDEKAFSTTAQARAPANFKETSKDWEDQFITKAELQDENGNPKTDFSIYDNMQAAWDFVIPANKAKSGDTMTVAIPSVLTLATVTKFDITDAGGTVIGHAVADPNTGKVTITLTDAVKNNHNAITGSFKLWVHWNTSEVEQDTTVPVNWGTSGSTDIHIDPSNGPGPDEVLYKWGWYDTNNPNIIHWRVRINYANKTINNAAYTDLVGGNQTLVSGSVSAYKVKFQSDSENFNSLSVYPDSATSENGTSGFKTTLGDISGPVIIDYETNITNNGASAHYENSGNLTGDNIEKQTVDVYSPDNGGGGNADTTITISGAKIWQDNNNQDGQRPSSITVNLLANGKQIQSQKVTATDKWQYSFEGLPEYDTDGQKIIYTVTEDKVTNYTTKIEGNNLINSYTPKQTSVTVTKSWQDHENQDGLRPDSIKVQLYANGEKQGDAVTLTQAKKWTYTWQGLAAKQNGKNIKYTVKEVGTVKGYTSTVNDKNQGNIVITNNHTPKTTVVSGTKIWQDNNNQDGQRPSSITVNLLANGKQIQSQKVTATDKWQYSFEGLPEYDTDGQKIIYTVTEDKVTNYTTKIEGNNLINSYTPKQTSVTVTKSWQDHENQDGLRPDSIKVQLYANGEKQGDAVTLTQAKKWTYTWQGLAAKQNGKNIKYTVKEVGTVKGYTSTVNDKNQGNIVITNNHTPNHKQHDTKPTQFSNSGPFTSTKVTNQAKKNKSRKYNGVGKWLIRHHLLPQTGEQEATWLLILGLGLLLFIAVAGVIVVNRRRSN